MAQLTTGRTCPSLWLAAGLAHGRHVAYDAEHNKPLCNFFLSMLPDMRLEIDAFGPSTGTLGWRAPF